MTHWPAVDIVIQVCGWTLLHSLWQGTLVAAIYAVLCRDPPEDRPPDPDHR